MEVGLELQSVKRRITDSISRLSQEKGLGFSRTEWPGRFFARDLLISSWQLLKIDSSVAKSVLGILCETQGSECNPAKEEEPGKIIHEPKGYFPYNNYGAADTTPLFLILFGQYFRESLDSDFLEEHWDNIRRAAKWLYNYGDADGDSFLEYQPKNIGGIYHQGWKESRKDDLKILPPVNMIEIQGYGYSAYREAAFLADFLDKKDFSLLFSSKAETMKDNFDKTFFIPQENRFCFALDRDKNLRNAFASNQGHLLLSGITEKTKEIVSSLFSEDLWTPFGIRTHGKREEDFSNTNPYLGAIWPHDNWLILEGLRKAGFLEESQKIVSSLKAAFSEVGSAPEFYFFDKGRVFIPETEKLISSWSFSSSLSFLLN